MFTSVKRDCFIKIDGHCNECGATGKKTILTGPLDNYPVQLEWRVNVSRNIPHKKERCVSHNPRKDLTGRPFSIRMDKIGSI